MDYKYPHTHSAVEREYDSDQRPSYPQSYHVEKEYEHTQRPIHHHPPPYGNLNYQASKPMDNYDAPQPSSENLQYGQVQIVVPKLEPQPWVKDVIGWLKTYTVGVARVDFCRPLPPTADQYQGNILFARRTPAQHHGRRGQGQQGHGQPQFVSYPSPYGGAEPYRGNQWAGGPTELGGYVPALPPQERSRLNAFLEPLRGPIGARLKIMRSLMMYKDPNGGRPLLDLGVGFNFDWDSQRLLPVARLKIKDWISIKAVPLGVVKVSRSLPLGNSGMAIKVLYELPLAHANEPWKPPARLMVRLDNSAGRGIHITPMGVEFDPQLMRLGQNLSLRASGTFKFPRSLPLDAEENEFGFQIHRLKLKTLW